MYEAPIKLMQRQLEIKEENGILQAVKEVGVVVDKEELIKALRYDRGQYDKGYSDGIKDFAEMLEDLSTERLMYEGYGETILENIILCTDVDNLVKEMMEGGVE